MPAESGTIAAPAAFNTAADAAPAFRPDFWVLKVTAGTSEISFDGIGVHLTLTSTDAAIVLPVSFKKLWARQSGGASSLRWSAMTND